ncbi:MAG: hypothetical protein R2830_25185 [Saprospiraceae bacterium]
MRSLITLTLPPLFFFLSTGPDLKGQPQDTTASLGIFDLLGREEIMDIELETNLDSLMSRKREDTYTKGLFTFDQTRKQTMTLPVNIRCRGKFRRMKCSFPPLKLKFKKSDLAAHGLNEFNELKLVTHCLDEKEKSKELILREYVVYKLYNILTPYSFRVQLVKVTYINTEKKGKKLKGWGIVIEDEEDLAHRMGGEKIDKMGIPVDSLDPFQEKVVSLFQFMAGNADWSILLNRNIQSVLMPMGTYFTVPYDFDYSALVSAPYARVDARLGQKTIRDRVFLGLADSLEAIKPAVELFLSKQDSLLEAIDDCPQLGMESKADMRQYLAEFFDIIKDDSRIANEVLLPAKKE